MAIYSPENFAMLLNCFELISHFLSEIEMKRVSRHVLEGFPARSSFIPECALSGKSCSVFLPPCGPGERRRYCFPLARFPSKAYSKFVLKTGLCGDIVLQGFRT